MAERSLRRLLDNSVAGVPVDTAELAGVLRDVEGAGVKLRELDERPVSGIEAGAVGRLRRSGSDSLPDAR